MPESVPHDQPNSVEPPPVAASPRPLPVIAPPPRPIPTPETPEIRSPNDEDRRRQRREARYWAFTALPSGLSSAVIHLLILLALAIFLVAPRIGNERISLEIVETEITTEEVLVELPVQIEPTPRLEPIGQPLWDSHVFHDAVDVGPIELESVAGGAPAPTVGPELLTMGESRGDQSWRGLSESISMTSRAERRQSALSYGATAQSENAVKLALEWIVKHQRRDGSWSLNHRSGPALCKRCRCTNPGSVSADNGATAMGLLPLLGAGFTHLDGSYQKNVAHGLRYLIDRQQSNGSFMDPGGNMYSHGLATLALCEALAMTRQQYRSPSGPESPTEPSTSVASSQNVRADVQPPRFIVAGNQANLRDDGKPTIRIAELSTAAQRAIQFIQRAQHTGGGWRYQPGQPGDTSVVGWQMMALRSGQLAGLDVSPLTVTRAVSFLDSVSEDQIGSCYGYMSGSRAAQVPLKTSIGATTPIGLLCRMYTGWERDQVGIQVGAERLLKWARPDKGMYYYYYATQVMHHFGGGPWQEWNGWMRDYLVKTQSHKGSETGSWQFRGSHDDAGRFYCTSMAAMTLEIYYRYVPIYSERAVQVPDFVDK